MKLRLKSESQLKNTFQFSCLFIVFCLLVFIQSSYAQSSDSELVLTPEEREWIDSHPVIKTGVLYDWPPFDFVEQGIHKGLSQDILDIISERTGLRFEYFKQDWNQLLENFRKGELDLLPMIYQSKLREEYSLYTQPYYSVIDFFFIREDLLLDQEINLNGKKVAIPKDYTYHEFIQKNYPEIEIINTSSNTEAIIAVLEGRADLLYDSYASISYLLKKNGVTGIVPYKASEFSSSTELHMAVAKDNETLRDILDKTLMSISTPEKNRLFSRWVNQTPVKSAKIHLTIEEEQWIEKHPVVTLGADMLWPPFEFSDEFGRHQGIAADYVKQIEQLTGLKIEVQTGVWSDMLSAAQNGVIYGLSSAVETEDRKKNLLFTKPYMSVPLVVVVRKDDIQINNISDLGGRSVALNSGSYLQEWLQKQHPEIPLYMTNSNEEALKAVAYGQADAYIGNMAVYDFITKKNMISNLDVILQLPDLATEPSFAINADHPILFSIIQKALDAIPPRTHLRISDNWYTSDFKQRHLDQVEADFLDDLTTVRYASKPYWMPFEGYSNDLHRGMAADYLKYLADLLDLTFVVLNSNDEGSGETIHLKTDEFDNYLNNPDYMVVSPHIRVPIVIVMDKEAPFVSGMDYLIRKHVAIPRNTSYASQLISEFPRVKWVNVDNGLGGFYQLLEGDIDALILPLPEAAFLLREYGADKLSINGQIDKEFKLSYYVNKKFPLLYSAINKAMANQTEEQKLLISQSWSKVQFAKQTDYRLIFIVSSVLLTISIAFFLWAKSLSREIEKRRVLQRALKTQKENFETLFDQSADGNMVLQNNRIVASNDTALRILGLDSLDQLKKRDLKEFLPLENKEGPNSYSSLIENLKVCKKVGRARFPLKVTTLKDQSYWLDVIFKTINYNSKESVYIVWRDITRQVELTEQLKEAQERADIANQAKSDFLANMSHEIRTPMNAILGFTELMREQVTNPQHKNFLRTIQSAGKNLMLLINDILDISKIEAGKMSIKKDVHNPFELFTEICQIFSLEMRKKGLELYEEIDDSIPKGMLLDAQHLRQVLFNLMGNAVKFTNKGSITFRVQSSERDRDLNLVNLHIEIEDTGIGIKKSQQARIFEVFEQQKGQDANKYKGTGLGLAICKKLVELMGGNISVSSEPGHGACFKVVLNNIDIVEESDFIEPEKDHNTQVSFASSTVLVVDDVDYNRELISQIFNNTPVKIIEAENGLEAIDAVDKNQLDLVIMDIKMPVLNGYEATKILKKKYPDLVVIALTASTLESQENIQKEVFDEYLRKPIEKSKLLNLLTKFLPVEEIENTIKEKNGDERNSEIKTLTEESIESLSEKFTADVYPSWKRALQSQNLNDLGSFINSLKSLNESVLASYIETLEQQKEAFDISGILSSLNDFAQIAEQFKSCES